MSTPSQRSFVVRGTVVFDGDCGYCRAWVRRWRERTGDAVDYVPFQSLDDPYRGVAKDEFRKAVWFFTPEGPPVSGAAAVLTLRRAGRSDEGALLRMYRRFAWFAAAADAAYRLVAHNRSFFSRFFRPGR